MLKVTMAFLKSMKCVQRNRFLSNTALIFFVIKKNPPCFTKESDLFGHIETFQKSVSNNLRLL